MKRIDQSYDLSAAEFERKFVNNKEYIKQVSRFAKLFPESSSILDMGCGPGLNARIFAKNSLKVNGFDISPEMVRLAMKNCPSGTFAVSSIKDYRTDLVFSGICLSFIIVHLKNSEVAGLIDRLPQLLQAGGKVYVSFMTGKKAGYETTSFSRNKIFFNYFDNDFIISCFQKNRFFLSSASRAPYTENDGTITEDIFSIFELM